MFKAYFEIKRKKPQELYFRVSPKETKELQFKVEPKAPIKFNVSSDLRLKVES